MRLENASAASTCEKGNPLICKAVADLKLKREGVGGSLHIKRPTHRWPAQVPWPQSGLERLSVPSYSKK
jgi:hypothetical protein